ncbi:MAG TPA: AAA family ATPase [Egibacteraceae bacterium]|nr:AAA family ATPase [Egibacteraceae bacterium]
MRIALAGKGGAGKTTTSATLARLLALGGTPVVAIDADSNPNLSFALGVPREEATQARGLPTSLVSRRLGGPGLTQSLDTALDRHAIVAPDGVRVLLMGMPAHAEEGCLCSAHATVSAVLEDLGTRQEVVTIMDMEASPEHLSRGTARHVDQLLLITEPYYRSLETARRMAALAAELPISRVAVVGNKIRSEGDAEAIGAFSERHGLEVAGYVPWSDAVTEADAQGVPLVERDPDGPAVQAIAELARGLVAYQFQTAG